MKTTILLLAIFSSLASVAQSKSYIYVGDNQYESAFTYTFCLPEGACNTFELDISIGKNGSSGILMLEAKVTFPDIYIGGNVYLFLDDGSRITCTDKNVKDKVDGKSIAVYYLTAGEIELLKEKDITTVRFTLLPLSMGNCVGDYTANNYGVFCANDSRLGIYDTSARITELFK